MRAIKLQQTIRGLILIAVIALCGLAVSCENDLCQDCEHDPCVCGNTDCNHIYGGLGITLAGYHDGSKDECITGAVTKNCLQCGEAITHINPCLGTQGLVFTWHEDTNDIDEYWDNEQGQMVQVTMEYPEGWVVTSNTGNRALDVVCIPDYWDDSGIRGKQPVSSIGLEAFGHRDFNNPSQVNSVTIGANVTVISNHAFHNCTNLETVTFAAGSKLETIGEAAFRYNKFESITIPASVTTIEDSAFQSNEELTTITFAQGSLLETIGPYAFANTNIESILIPESVTSIGDAAFRGCENLKDITSILARITVIGNSMFQNCTSLENVIIPANITDIGQEAFKGNESLITVTFAAGSQLETIGLEAFANCIELENITIPASLTIIGDRAFLQCTSLNLVTVLAVTPPELGEYVFYTLTWGGHPMSPTPEYNRIPNLEIKVPAASYFNYIGATGWSDYTNIIDMM